MSIRAQPASRGPGRLPAEEAARIDDRLLDAATELFFAHGYERTTMEGVARAAGASTKTLYARYNGKAELLLAAIRHYLARAIPATAEAEAAPDGLSARATLRALAWRLARVSSSPEATGLNRLMFAESHRFPELGGVMMAFHDQAVGTVQPTLERLEQDGLIGPLPDPRLSAHLFLEMACSTPRLGAMLGLPMPDPVLGTLIDTAVDLFLDGCATRA